MSCLFQMGLDVLAPDRCAPPTSEPVRPGRGGGRANSPPRGPRQNEPTCVRAPVNRFFLRRRGTPKPSWAPQAPQMFVVDDPPRLAVRPSQHDATPTANAPIEEAIRTSRRRHSCPPATGGKSCWVERCLPTTRHALRSDTPEPLTQHHNGGATTVRRQTFPSANSIKHVDIQSLIRDELLQPNVLRLKLLQPLRITGFHAAVLGEPPMPR